MSNQFPHGYALLVGIGQTEYARWSLPGTVKDVQSIRAILLDPNLCAYPDDEQHIRLLHDAGATRQAILEGLAWLQAQAQKDPEATVVVYYSGHGWLDRATDKYYLIPHDVDPVDVTGTALPAQEFNQALRATPARRLLVFVDACHAEGMATAKKAEIRLPANLIPASLPKGLVEEIKQGEGRAVFTSCRGEQSSWVRPDGTQSIYTYHLVEALQGAGNQPGDMVVNVSNLMSHLGRAVPESARTLCQAEQTPFFDTATEDFAIAVLRGGKGLPAGGWETVRHEAAVIQPIEQHITQALGERSVAIGGSAARAQIVTGDHGVAQRGKYNINIGEAQGVVVGDQAQVTQSFVGRDVRDSTLVTAGRDAHLTQSATPEQIRALFAPILAQVRTRPEDPDADKAEIAETVEKVRDETARGEQAHPGKLARWLRFLVGMAPDIGDVVIKTLANPLNGLAEVVRKVAARARAEQAGLAGG